MFRTLVVSAASVPIGVLTTIDSVRMDNSQVRGNGTVLDGSVIETAKNPSQLSLKNGTRFDLCPNSQATVYLDRIVLDRGASQIHGSSAYAVVVNSLRIVPIGPASTIRVSRNSPRTIEVAAVTGRAEVRDAKGLLIAKVFPGSALDFDQQPGGAAGPSQVSGKVSKQGGHYFLTDSTTNTTVELQGDNLDSAVGHCIAATGSADPSAVPAPGATQLIHVATYQQVTCGGRGKKGAVAGGAAGGAAAGGAAAGGAAAAGLSGAVIGGIAAAAAVGGTVGGLAAAGTFSGGKATTTSGQ